MSDPASKDEQLAAHLPGSAPSSTHTANVDETATAAQRTMTFEEFRQFYVASRQSNFRNRHASPTAPLSSPPSSSSSPADGTRAAVTSRDAAATLRHRPHDLQDRGAPPAALANPAVPPVAPEQLTRRARILQFMHEGFPRWIDWAANHLTDLLQAFLTFFTLYVYFGMSIYRIAFLLGVCLVLMAVRALLDTVYVRHEDGATQAPSFLGRLFRPEGHTGPVSMPRKVVYVVMKCVEAFLLSLFPTYSLEHLERELAADGIVR